MAAQAVGFSSGPGHRGMDGVQMLQQEPLRVCGNLGIGEQQQPQIRIDPSVFSELKRGLTCNVSAPAKRARAEEFLALNGYNQMAASPLLPYLEQAAVPVKLAGTSAGLLPQNRLPESGATSASGRHDSSLQPVLSSSGDLVSLISQKSLEIDAFICLQKERMLNEFKEMRSRHCRTVLSSPC